MYRLAWILVEGPDDTRFVEKVLCPILVKHCDHVGVWEYAQEKPKKTAEFLRAIKSMNAQCLFLADIDDSPCVSAKKEILRERFRQTVEPADTVVVVKEIESWYVAGVDNQACQELGIASLPHTNDVTKERFRRMVRDRFRGSVVDSMTELLDVFRVDVARAKNRSFRYLMDLLEARSRET